MAANEEVEAPDKSTSHNLNIQKNEYLIKEQKRGNKMFVEALKRQNPG